jgi:hypothetical protein
VPNFNSEYEHLQFLWGAGQDKVMFPAILGLLNDYAEVWMDATPTSSNGSDTLSIRTVPWISDDQIAHLYSLGKHIRYSPVTKDVIELGSKVSVAAALKHGVVSESKGRD